MAGSFGHPQSDMGNVGYDPCLNQVLAVSKPLFGPTKRWQNDLVDTSGRSRLRRYRDLRTGTLDLTPGRTYGLDASALDRLLAGKPVSLSDLFPDYPDGSDDSAAFNDARRRLTAIHKTALHEP